MRTIPQDLEAETSVLGAILLRNEAIHQVDSLSPEDFYDPRNRLTFQAMRLLSAERRALDPIILEDKLKAMGAEAVDILFLSTLLSGIVTADNIKYYADIVKDKATLRRVIQVSAEISAKGYETDNVQDYLDHATREIAKAATNDLNYGPRSISLVMRDTMRQHDARLGTEDACGVPTGYLALNRYKLALEPSELIILAARPGIGKTALAGSLCANSAIGAKCPTLFFSLEMSSAQIGERLLYSEARVPMSAVRDRTISKAQLLDLSLAHGRIVEAPILVDDSPNLTPTEIRSRSLRWRSSRDLWRESKYGLVIVDYLQLMRVRGLGKNANREQEISEISRSLKQLAKELECPVLALSQLNRNVEARADKHPLLSDLRESGSIEQDADCVLLLYRNEYYHQDTKIPGVADLDVAKNRNGPTGRVQLKYRSEYTRFDDMPAYDF
jgi:replicative DNA helicase